MFKISSKTISAIVAAGSVAALLTVLPGITGQVSANSSLSAGKGDRASIQVAAVVDCAQQSWPNIDAACVKDSRQPMSQAKAVRVVGAERR